MTTKYEQWRNQTLVNRLISNEEIVRENKTFSSKNNLVKNAI